MLGKSFETLLAVLIAHLIVRTVLSTMLFVLLPQEKHKAAKVQFDRLKEIAHARKADLEVLKAEVS